MPTHVRMLVRSLDNSAESVNEDAAQGLQRIAVAKQMASQLVQRYGGGKHCIISSHGNPLITGQQSTEALHSAISSIIVEPSVNTLNLFRCLKIGQVS